LQCQKLKNMNMSNYRLLKKKKAEKILDKIKNNSPSIIFKTKTMTVTLKTKEQLKKWLDMYPTGEYTFATEI
jgi:hypothetical protein